ncbi:MAG: 30S ribosomal protein S16 [Anaerolineae bacterium]|nr:30S ribosomal protein S16 [Anaerolineae bacterium]
MVRIRLSRTGLKKQPSYRVVVAHNEAKRDGKFIELIGHYNPRTEPLTYKIQEDRALYWLSVGAQASDAVRRLLEKQGTYDRLTRFHNGESLAVLVAEYEGKPLPVAEVAPVTPLEVVEEVALEVTETDVEELTEAEVEEVAEAEVEEETDESSAANEG